MIFSGVSYTRSEGDGAVGPVYAGVMVTDKSLVKISYSCRLLALCLWKSILFLKQRIG